MEDVQDGIKVSIQDGVEEDPEIIERLDIQNKSFAGLIFIVTEMANPEVKCTLNTQTSSGITATMTSSVVGVVT